MLALCSSGLSSISAEADAGSNRVARMTVTLFLPYPTDRRMLQTRRAAPDLCGELVVPSLVHSVIDDQSTDQKIPIVSPATRAAPRSLQRPRSAPLITLGDKIASGVCA